MRVLAILLLCSPAVAQWQTAAPERSAFITAKPSPVIQGTATQEPAPVKAKPPQLIATVADRGCPPCDRWERETLPALIEAGWRVRVDRVPYGSQTTPSFRRVNHILDGYSTRKNFMAWLAADPVKPAPAGASLPATVAVGGGVPAAAVVSYVPPDPRGGHWSFPGDIRSHLMRPPHNFSAADLAGLSYEQLLTLHDLNHESGYRPSRRAFYPQPVAQAFCPTCPGGR